MNIKYPYSQKASILVGQGTDSRQIYLSGNKCHKGKKREKNHSDRSRVGSILENVYKGGQIEEKYEFLF